MNTISRSKSAFGGAVVAQVFTLLSMLVAIVTTPLMVRYLDAEAYGLSILFFQVLGYLHLFDFGLSTAVIRNMALHQPNAEDEQTQIELNRIASTSFFVSGLLGLIILVTIFFLAPFTSHLFHMRADLVAPSTYILLSLGVVILTTFIQRGLGGMFFAHHRQALITLPSSIISVLSVVGTVWLLSRGMGLWAFVYVNLTTAGLNLLIHLVLVRVYYPRLRLKWQFFDLDLLKSLFSFGAFMFLAGLATQVILYTDRLVIGRVISLAAVAVFSITVRIPEVCLILLSHVTYHALPALTEIVNRGDEPQIRRAYHRLAILTSSLSTVAFWLMLSMNEWFIRLWVGPSFFAGHLVLALALLVMMQQALARTGVFFLNAKGIARPLSFMAIGEAALNITLSVFLGYRLGLAGVLLGTLIAAACTSGWFVPLLLRRHLGISATDYWLRSFLVPLFTLSGAGAVLYAGVRWVRNAGSPGWLSFFLIGAVCGLSLMAVAWYGFLREPLGDYVPARLRPYLGLRMNVQAKVNN